MSLTVTPTLAEVTRRIFPVTTTLTPAQEENVERAYNAVMEFIRGSYPHAEGTAVEAEVILLMCSRLVKREGSPDGISGWSEEGPVRITSVDPDVRNLLEPYRRLVFFA